MSIKDKLPQEATPKILITGCGRSGTRYVSEALKEWGLDVGHEIEGKNGTADWYKALNPKGYDLVLHQVRHPLDAIMTLHTLSDQSWEFISKNTTVKESDPMDLKCMKYWFEWNLMAEHFSIATYRVEAITPLFPNTKSDHNSRINMRTKRKTWKDLEKIDKELAEGIRLLALKYGYADA